MTLMNPAICLAVSLGLAASTAAAAEPVSPATARQNSATAAAATAVVPSYAFASPSEPLLEKLSLAKAADSLDQVSHAWIQKHKCGSCHTSFPYLISRPALEHDNSGPLKEIHTFFESRVRAWDADLAKNNHAGPEVVGTACAMALYDARTTGKLDPLTRQALNRVWTLQDKDGVWSWTQCGWQPFEVDKYFGALLAAVGAGHAPDGYAAGDSAKAGLEKLRAYFRGAPPPSLHHQVWLLWAATKLDGIMSAESKNSTIEQLRSLQRPDGSWSMRSLGKDWVGQAGEKSDPNALGDGYGTGLCVFVLREAGVSATDLAIQRGKAWLSSNQRVSGRWFTPSINGVEEHYISDTATAFAVLALAGD